MCSGSTLRTCRSDGSGWIDLNCPEGCSAERCNACNPNQGRTCDGTSAKQCMSDGSGFQLTPCSRGCAAGSCCTGNNEARGGTCSACGGNNQPCCDIAAPGCNGSLACLADRCVVPCGPNDGQCPGGCSFSQDSDCKKPRGQSCGNDSECADGNCADGVCCNSACNDSCRACNISGKVGTCSPPSTSETCGDGRDNNCNGQTDEGCAQLRIMPATFTFGDPGPERTTGDTFVVQNTGEVALRLTEQITDPGEPNTCGFFQCGSSECADRLLQPGQSCAKVLCAFCTGVNVVPGRTYSGAYAVTGCYELDASCTIRSTARATLNVARRTGF
jgi:hypothetical protein